MKTISTKVSKVTLAILFYVCLFIFILGNETLRAVPASNKLIKIKQADSTELTIQLHGDEYRSWISTPDGYSIMQGKDGFYEYVEKIKNGVSISSGIRVHELSLREQSEIQLLKKLRKNLSPQSNTESKTHSKQMLLPESERKSPKSITSPHHGQWLFPGAYDFASRDSFNVMVVLVNFPDCPLQYPLSTYDSLLNGVNYTGHGNHGSVRDYFQDMSQGRFIYQAKIIEYTATKTQTSYAWPASHYAKEETAGSELKKEVALYVQSKLKYNFDGDANGAEHISIIFAGRGQENTANPYHIWSNNGFCPVEGTNKVINVSCVAEIDNFMSRLGLSTYCHEFGHVLGLPDLYDTDYEEEGLSEHPAIHDLMSSGNGDGHPVPLSAFSRYSLGWLRIESISQGGDFQIKDFLKSKEVFRINTSTPGEFFVLENRVPEKWQSNLDQGHGLLIFRVDSAYYVSHLRDNTINASKKHLGYEVLRADNNSSRETTKADFFPYGGLYTSFTDATTPSAKSLSGANTSKPITQITENNPIISFQLMGGGNGLNVFTRQVALHKKNVNVQGGILLIGNVKCTEKGVCYGFLPSPTIEDNKIISDSVLSTLDFEISITGLEEDRMYYIRAYAKDGQGNVSYGSELKIKPKFAIQQFPYCIKKAEIPENGDLPLIDWSTLKNPIAEVYEARLQISEVSTPPIYRCAERLVLSRPSGGSIIIEPSQTYIKEQYIKGKISSEDKLTFNLPQGAFGILNIKSILDYLGYHFSSVVIREQENTNSLISLPYAETYTEKFVENEYGDNRFLPVSDTILYVNTIACQNPILHIRVFPFDCNNGNNGILLAKGSEEKLFHGLQKESFHTDKTLFYSYAHDNGSNKTYKNSMLYDDYFFALPKDTNLSLALINYAEIHLWDASAIPLIDRINILSDSIIEVESLVVELNPKVEQGFCWNLTAEASGIDHKVVCTQEGRFIAAFTSIPPQKMVYIRAYSKIGSQITYGKAVVSKVGGSGRENKLAYDMLNPIKVVFLDENPTNYTLRVRYNPASLKQESIAQGICYATRPEGGSPSQPNENNTILLKKGKAQEIAYFNLEACIKDGYNNQTRDIRSFILTKDGQYLLDSVFSINFRFGDKYDQSFFCQTLPAQLYIPYNFMEQSDVTLKMWEVPFNVVMTEAYVNILEGYNFFSITAHENAPDTIVVRSPLLIQTDALYPQIKFSLTKQRPDNAGELRPLHNINVYAQNATNKEKFYIGTIAARKMSDTNTERLYSFNTKVAGDSIYLLFEMQNSSDLLMVDQFEIKDDPSFTVQTKPIEVLRPNLQGQKQRLSFKGNYILDVSLPPILEAGFIYTTGEPLVSGGADYGDTTERKWDTIRATPNADGVFSVTFDYPTYSNIYVRAYVKNALSFALSSPQMAKAYYGDYTVFSEYLPVKDSRKIKSYSTSIRHSQYGEEILLNEWYREDIDLMVSANLFRPRKNFCELGRLQITHRPILNKIKVNAVIGVKASNAPSPEAILPTLAIYYKTKISSAEGEMDYWNNLDSSQYTITFLEKSKPPLDSDIVTFFFTLEAYFPRDLERIAAECDRQWEIIFSNKEGGRGDHGGGILYSESNIRDSKATAPSIEYLTVENNKIQLYWQISNLTNVNAMRVYRESNQLGVYELLKEYPLSMLQSLSGVFQDTNARPDRRAYAYILKSVNSEGTEFASMPHKSIHLSINKGLQNQWNLSWTPYEGRTIASTSVYRGSAMDTLQFLEQIPGSNHTYTDVEASEKVLFYRIETKFTSPKFSKSLSAKTTSTPSSLSNIVNNANKPLTTEYQVSYTQPLYGEIDVLFNNQKVTSGTYLDSASNLTLRVRPNEGYTFDSWWDGNRNINRNYLLTSDIQIRVNLVSNTQKKQYNVFFEQPINGEIEITNYTNIFPGNYYTFDSASILQLKAIPNTNYKLKSWWDGKTEVKRTYLISSDVNINAFFEKKIAIENQAIHSLFKVYPNPVKGTLYIQNHSSFSISQIELTDIKGFIKIVAPSVYSNYTSLDLQSLSKGLYILRIYTSEGVLIYKIAKQ